MTLQQIFGHDGHDHDEATCIECGKQPPYVKAEMAALDKFCDVATLNIAAVVSGRWDDTATWNGAIPSATDRVYIPAGVVVEIDSTAAVADFIRVDGTLRFARDKDTRLLVTTIVGPECGSTLDAGTQADPITAQCEVVFRSKAPDIVADPREFGTGYVGHKTLIWGQAKDSQAEFAEGKSGSKSITFTKAPLNWKAGDVLVIAGTGTGFPSPPYNTQEKVVVTAVNGATVSFEPALGYPHKLAADNCFAINLSRNIVFRSERPGYGATPYATINAPPPAPAVDPIVKERGHVMIMGCGVGQSEIGYAEFRDLGRTDKRTHLDAVKFRDGKRVEVLNGFPSGQNQVGRYALHFHHGGRLGSPAKVHGCSVSGSPGWGFTNHSSSVDFNSCVAFDAIGAGFAAEIGDEVGEWRDCAAIGSVGGYANRDGVVNNPQFDREQGTNGSGFWLQSGRVKVRGIKAANCNTAVTLWPPAGTQVYSSESNRVVGNIMGSIDPADVVDDADKYLLDSIDPASGTIDTGRAAADWEGGLFFSCKVATLDVGPHFPKPVKLSSFRKLVVYGTADLQYTTHVSFSGCRWEMNPGKATPNAPYIQAVKGNGGDNDSLVVKDSILNLAGVSVSVPMGVNIVSGNQMSGATDVFIKKLDWTNISSIAHRPRETWVEGNTHKYKPIGWEGPVSFVMDRVVFNGRQLYAENQAADYVPVPSADPLLTPPYFVGKTNAQLLAEYGIAVNGDVMPADAVIEPSVGFKAGTISKRLPVVVRQGYQDLRFQKPSGGYHKVPVEVYPIKQRNPVVVEVNHPFGSGWQQVPITYDGLRYSVSVYGTGNSPAPGEPEPPPVPVPVVTSIEVTPANVVLEVGKTAQLTATVKDQFGTAMPGKVVTWQSSNTAVATIAPTGVCSAVAGGNAVLNASLEGKAGAANITVTSPPPPAPKTIRRVVIEYTDGTTEARP